MSAATCQHKRTVSVTVEGKSDMRECVDCKATMSGRELAESVSCGICEGRGVVDSGGATPWGEGIEVACGHCGGSGQEPESVSPPPLEFADVQLYSTEGDDPVKDDTGPYVLFEDYGKLLRAHTELRSQVAALLTPLDIQLDEVYIERAKDFLCNSAKMQDSPLVWMIAAAFKNEDKVKASRATIDALTAQLHAAEFDVMRLISALSCIRVSLGIGEARTTVTDALVIPAEVIHAFAKLKENADGK